MIRLFVTWFFSGLAPKGPGTAGSLAALPFAAALHAIFGMVAVGIGAVILFFAGWWASNRYMRQTGQDNDPKEIVIDEVVGMWLTLAVMPLMYMQPTLDVIIVIYGVAFIFFRIFDILKPWPVSWVDKQCKGGFGVMFDDVLAALFAALVLGALGHVLGYMGLVTITLGEGHV